MQPVLLQLHGTISNPYAPLSWNQHLPCGAESRSDLSIPCASMPSDLSLGGTI
jgi:hypothetical protein